METPEAIREAVAAADRKHPGDAQKAIAHAKRLVKALPEFADFAEFLFHRAVQDLLYHERGRATHAARLDAGYYGRPAKVRVGESEAVARAFESAYQYRMGGKVLGDLTGAELDAVARSEERGGRTKLLNADLARWCRRQGVGDEQSVRDAIPLKKLEAAKRRILGRDEKVAA